MSERQRIRREFISDKISIFKMATTCGDVVTHLINSQRGVDLIRGVSWVKFLIDVAKYFYKDVMR